MRGVNWILLTALISGISIFLNAFGVSVVSPSIFTTMKNSMVALFVITVLIATTQIDYLKKLSKKQWLQLASIGLIGGSIPFLLFFNGLAQIGSASGSFIHKLMFIFVGILAFIFLKEKVSWKTWVGAIALVAGNTLLLSITNFSFNTGMFLVLAATLFWAGEITLSKKVLKDIKPNIVVLGRLGFGAIFLNIYLIVTGEFSKLFTLNVSQIGWIFFTAILLLGYNLTFYNGLKQVKATFAAMILLLGSAITSLLQLVFLDKVFTFPQVLGIVLLFAGIIATIYFERKLIFSAPHTQDA